MESKFVPIPEYGEFYTLKEFLSYVECGGFIPYDGCGNYATATQMDDNSDVWGGKPPTAWATHVMWFNK